MTEETTSTTLPAPQPDTPAPPQEPKAPESGQPAPAPKAARVWPLWLGILILAAALVAVSGWFWIQIEAWQSRLELAIEHSQSSSDLMGQANQRYEAKLAQLDTALERQKTQLEEVSNQLDQTARRILTVGETGRTDWLLAESEYLLRLANQRLHMERDYQGSLAILKAADQVLAETKEVAVFPVRKALAGEIVSLEAVADVDRQGIYLRLEALIEQIETLDQRMFFQESPLLNEPQPEPAQAEEQHWYDRPLNAIRRLEKYFVIRQMDEPVEPLLAPEQIYYLQQNLRLMLEQAELALLDKNQQVYEQSLSKAESWINNYFITNSPVTKAMQKNLADLKQRDIDPTLPDISESLRLLKNLMESVYKRNAAELQSPTGTAPANAGDAS